MSTAFEGKFQNPLLKGRYIPIIVEFSGSLIRVGGAEKSLTSYNLMANEMFLALGVDRMTETRCSWVSPKFPRIQKVLEIFLYLENVKRITLQLKT